MPGHGQLPALELPCAVHARRSASRAPASASRRSAQVSVARCRIGAAYSRARLPGASELGDGSQPAEDGYVANWWTRADWFEAVAVDDRGRMPTTMTPAGFCAFPCVSSPALLPRSETGSRILRLAVAEMDMGVSTGAFPGELRSWRRSYRRPMRLLRLRRAIQFHSATGCCHSKVGHQA
jgi:hypothetical protein